jgi:acetyl esterase/lipase/PKD repeat protein
MRYLLAIASVIFLTVSVYAQQSGCQSNRYQKRIFPHTIQYQNIEYGRAMNYLDQQEALTMNVFEPAGDSLAKRPLIIFAHPGGFQAGSKNADDMMAMCDTFARKGYVTATIGYRKGFVSTNAGVKRAVYRALQDGKAAVRYFRHYADSYRIDTNHIFMAGSSAGAFIALHAAYADKSSERPPSTYGTPVGPDLGCMDCSGNSFSNSSEVQGIVSMWGAMPDTGMIEGPQDPPALLLHGTDDLIVPMKTGHPFSTPFFPQTHGSEPISQRMQNVGVTHECHPYSGKGHEVYGATNGSFVAGGPNALWDTVLNEMTAFFYEQLQPPTPQLTGDTSICQGDTGTYRVSAPSTMQHCWEVDSGTIINLTDSTARIAWQDSVEQGQVHLHSLSCIRVPAPDQTLNVPLKLLPDVTVSNDTAICPGEAIKLQVSGAATYQWAPANALDDPSIAAPTASPQSSTSFTVKGFGANGCRSRRTVNVSMHSVPVADFDVDGNPPQIDFTDQSAQAVQWRWSFGDGDTSHAENTSHTYANDSFYTVELITENSHGCTDTAEEEIAVFSNPTAIETSGGKDDWRIHRTGTSRYLLKLPTVSTHAKRLRVYSISGQQLINRTVKKSSVAIDLAGRGRGLAIIKIIGRDKTLTKKVIY